MKKSLYVLLGAGLLLTLFLVQTGYAQDIDFSRLMIYDIRGSDAEETILVIDQRGPRVSVWMKNYLGERRGDMPENLYRACFQTLLDIPEFALKAEYRGKNLRAHAAHGTLTLAWKDPQTGKQLRTIRYFAPEHTLDDFRAAFNSAWALSRFAILSVSALESRNTAIREDALYFLSGAGWLTAEELSDVMAYHRQANRGSRLAQALWASADLVFPKNSEFSTPAYLDYCIEKSMVRLGAPAREFLSGHSWGSERKNKLSKKILDQLAKPQVSTGP